MNNFKNMMDLLTTLVEKGLEITGDEELDEVIRLGVEEYIEESIGELLEQVISGKKEEQTEREREINISKMAEESRIL